jgi:hypothetical protein
MLNQRNGNGLAEGVYERERLRSRARKLGLHLVKTREQSAPDAAHSAPLPGTARLIVAPAGNASERATELDKCG